MKKAILLFVATLVSHASLADCTPDKADARVDCISCGNLEQNPKRAIDRTWNAGTTRTGPKTNDPLRTALRWRGFATVNLMHPPHSSPGVTFYRGIIRDPNFRITNTESYSRALGLQAQLNFNLYQPGYIQLRGEIRRLLSSSTSTGTDPYIVSVYDQDGRLIARETIERGTATMNRTTTGKRDLVPDPRYTREECLDKDPRHNGQNSNNQSSRNGGAAGSGRSGPSGQPSKSGPWPPAGPTRCGFTQVDDGPRRRTCRRV